MFRVRFNRGPGREKVDLGEIKTGRLHTAFHKGTFCQSAIGCRRFRNHNSHHSLRQRAFLCFCSRRRHPKKTDEEICNSLPVCRRQVRKSNPVGLHHEDARQYRQNAQFPTQSGSLPLCETLPSPPPLLSSSSLRDSNKTSFQELPIIRKRGPVPDQAGAMSCGLPL